MTNNSVAATTHAPVAVAENAPAAAPPAAVTNAPPVDPTATQPKSISVSLADIGMTGPCKIRDLWTHKDLDAVDTRISVTVNSHGAALYRVSPAR
jgi:hypothetical protein